MKTTLLSYLAIVAAACCVTSCYYDEIPKHVDCALTDLKVSVVSKTDATSCKSINGQITVAASGGKGPYNFSLGSGPYQTNPVFDKLGPGSYSIMVKDVQGCTNDIEVNVAAANSNLIGTATATADTQCLTDNGSISVVPSGGSPPYTVKIDNGTFGTATTFTKLSGGPHDLIVKDAQDCESFIHVHVENGNSGVSYSNEIGPIFNVNCNLSGCHGSGTTGRDFTKFSDIKTLAENIKNRTSNKSMPIGGLVLTPTQIQLIACWVNDGAINN